METRPRVPRPGTAPRQPVGHHPAATRRRETRPAAPATRWGVKHKSATRGERKEVWRAGAPTHRAGEPQTPWGSGRVAGEAAYRDRRRGGDNHPTRAKEGRCAVRMLDIPRRATHRRDGGPREASPRTAGSRRGGSGTRGPAWGSGRGGATWLSTCRSGMHKRATPRYPADPVQSWSIPHPHSAPHPLPGLRPGAQTHQVRGQWPHSAATHSQTWSGGARVGAT